MLRAWLAAGRIRRYGALVSHLRLGFTANAMMVMAVPQERIEEVGDDRLAASPDVSHCYQRPSFADFPYTSTRWCMAPMRCLRIVPRGEGNGVGHGRAVLDESTEAATMALVLAAQVSHGEVQMPRLRAATEATCHTTSVSGLKPR